ncbi:MAG: hypothetical protein DMG62_24905, partial [Acidobacteria bacterium]
KGILNEITDSLAGVQEEGVREKIRSKVVLAARAADALYGQTVSQAQNTMVKLAKEMDKKLDALVGNAGAQRSRSWAEVAAANASRTLPPSDQRAAVRVRLTEAEGKSTTELLEAVKPVIQGAYAVRRLRSGDVEVMLPNQRAKDQALNQAEVAGCKVLRQDYPVEVPGVPLATGIKHGKALENEEVAKAICNATKRTIPGIFINKIRWLHDAKGHDERVQAGKTRGTAIISFPTQAMQHEVIRKGVVIGAELFDARLYNNSLEMKQCFKCYGWGHTQAACGKQERCGECAGQHPTRDCKKERVSCVNCGRGHRAWQKRACNTFQTFLEETKKKRINLVVQTAAVRNASTNDTQNPLLATLELPASRKRPRVPSTQEREQERTQERTQSAKKGKGRPTNIEVAGRDRSKSHIRLSTPQTVPSSIPSSFWSRQPPPQASSSSGSSMEADMSAADPINDDDEC